MRKNMWLRAPAVSIRPREVGVVLVSLLSLLAVSYVDYATGYELLFFVFYFIPVVWCAWWLGLGSTLGMAVLSGVSWFVVDRLSGHPYPSEVLRYGNSFICSVAFAAIGVVLCRLRRSLSEQQHTQQKLVKSLEQLKQATEELRRLQSQVQVVCAWTKRIRIDGQWVPLEQFLAEQLHLSISHGISPEGVAQVKKSMGEERAA